LYASSPTTLVRWKYSPKDRKVGSAPIVVVQNIPGDGHRTRTPKVDLNGFIYLSLGSASNIDSNADHAQVDDLIFDNLLIINHLNGIQV